MMRQDRARSARPFSVCIWKGSSQRGACILLFVNASVRCSFMFFFCVLLSRTNDLHHRLRDLHIQSISTNPASMKADGLGLHLTHWVCFVGSRLELALMVVLRCMVESSVFCLIVFRWRLRELFFIPSRFILPLARPGVTWPVRGNLASLPL